MTDPTLREALERLIAASFDGAGWCNVCDGEIYNGHGPDCEVALALAALAAAPAEWPPVISENRIRVAAPAAPALDVERLALADHETMLKERGHCGSEQEAWDDHIAAHRWHYEKIAAEYARLAGAAGEKA